MGALKYQHEIHMQQVQNGDKIDDKTLKPSNTNAFKVFRQGSNPSHSANLTENPEVEKLPDFSCFTHIFRIFKRIC